MIALREALATALRLTSWDSRVAIWADKHVDAILATEAMQPIVALTKAIERLPAAERALHTGEALAVAGARMIEAEKDRNAAREDADRLAELLETQTMFACRKGDESITPVACDTHYSAWQPLGECYYVEQIRIALAAHRGSGEARDDADD